MAKLSVYIARENLPFKQALSECIKLPLPIHYHELKKALSTIGLDPDTENFTVYEVDCEILGSCVETELPLEKYQKLAEKLELLNYEKQLQLESYIWTKPPRVYTLILFP